MSETLHAVLLSVMFAGGCVGFYFLGKASGYRRARDEYLPLLIDQGRASSRMLDELCASVGRRSDFVARQRAWEAELTERGIDVPEWEEPDEGHR